MKRSNNLLNNHDTGESGNSFNFDKYTYLDSAGYLHNAQAHNFEFVHLFQKDFRSLPRRPLLTLLLLCYFRRGALASFASQFTGLGNQRLYLGVQEIGHFVNETLTIGQKTLNGPWTIRGGMAQSHDSNGGGEEPLVHRVDPT